MVDGLPAIYVDLFINVEARARVLSASMCQVESAGVTIMRGLGRRVPAWLLDRNYVEFLNFVILQEGEHDL